MVIVKLTGGLGNQMFQYAAARRLALANGVPLKLDVSSFKDSHLRVYSLCPFTIKATLATKVELTTVNRVLRLRTRILRWIPTAKNFFDKCSFWKILQESQVCPLNQEVIFAKGNVYLEGYWQSERYFLDRHENIRADFAFKSEPEGENKKIAKKIANTNSIGIHVRRGDYVSSPQINQVHGICDLAYYRQCISLLTEKISLPYFFVFSDDPAWCKENLDLGSQVMFVDHNTSTTAHEDLRLMSSCKHQIIANSTFSWWAAWLNQNPDKMVFAPCKWFNINIDASDLLSKSWIKV